MGSNPAEGAFVNAGDQVSLITSTGYCKVRVPSVIEESQAQATATLKGGLWLPSERQSDGSLDVLTGSGRYRDQRDAVHRHLCAV